MQQANLKFGRKMVLVPYAANDNVEEEKSSSMKKGIEERNNNNSFSASILEGQHQQQQKERGREDDEDGDAIMSIAGRMRSINKRMRNIINSSTLSDKEKMFLYQQLFRQYMRAKNEMKMEQNEQAERIISAFKNTFQLKSKKIIFV